MGAKPREREASLSVVREREGGTGHQWLHNKEEITGVN